MQKHRLDWDNTRDAIGGSKRSVRELKNNRATVAAGIGTPNFDCQMSSFCDRLGAAHTRRVNVNIWTTCGESPSHSTLIYLERFEAGLVMKSKLKVRRGKKVLNLDLLLAQPDLLSQRS